jgi:hypothetical protein
VPESSMDFPLTARITSPVRARAAAALLLSTSSTSAPIGPGAERSASAWSTSCNAAPSFACTLPVVMIS